MHSAYKLIIHNVHANVHTESFGNGQLIKWSIFHGQTSCVIACCLLQPFADRCRIVVFFIWHRQAQMQPQWSLTVTTNFFPPEWHITRADLGSWYAFVSEPNQAYIWVNRVLRKVLIYHLTHHQWVTSRKDLAAVLWSKHRPDAKWPRSRW